MTRIFVAVLFVAVLPRPVIAQSTNNDQLFAAGLGAYAAAAVIDAKTTIDCSLAHLCREANPVLVPLVNNHGVEFAMATKLAAQAGLGYALYRLRPRYRTQTAWALAALVGIQIAVDGINYSRLRAAERQR